VLHYSVRKELLFLVNLVINWSHLIFAGGHIQQHSFIFTSYLNCLHAADPVCCVSVVKCTAVDMCSLTVFKDGAGSVFLWLAETPRT
jgi:hypothetical protein